MTQFNRSDLNTDISSKIYTNVGRLIKGNTVRDRLLNFAASTLNIIDDANAADGYMAIDSDGIVDISFIKKLSPTGQFLRDDGTWQTVLVSTPGLTDVLAVDNVMYAGESITSEDTFSRFLVRDTGWYIRRGVSGDYNNLVLGDATSVYIQYNDEVAGTLHGWYSYADRNEANSYTENKFIAPNNNFFGNATVSSISGVDEAYLTVSTSGVQPLVQLFVVDMTGTSGLFVNSANAQFTHVVRNDYDAPIHEFTGNSFDASLASSFYVYTTSGDYSEMYLVDGTAYLSNSLVGGFYATNDGVLVNRFQVASANNQMVHTVQNFFGAPIHYFNNIICLDNLNFTYDGNSEGLVNIDTGNDYGGIKNGSQYVMLNSNTGYIEVYSSNTVKLRVSNDNGGLITFTAPSIETNATIYFTSGQGIDSKVTGGTDIVNVGGTNADVVNIGRAGGIVNILGQYLYEYAANQYVLDKLITLNYNGAGGSAVGSGIEMEAGGAIVGYIKINAAQTGFSFKSPDTSYYADLIFTGFAANRTIQMPDADGTLALSTVSLSQFAATTSAQLAGVISDETGTGALVFGTSPTLSNPVVGTQSANDNSTKAASTAYVDAADALKLNLEAGATTGTVLTFTEERVYGTIASPETGNLTFSTTGAKRGIVNLVIHNHSVAPTFSTMKKSSASQNYVLSVVNHIYVEYVESGEIIYTIIQRT
jgi:hypothetical protein